MARRRRRPKPLVPKAGPVRIIRPDGTVSVKPSLTTKAGTQVVRAADKQADRTNARIADRLWGRPGR